MRHLRQHLSYILISSFALLLTLWSSLSYAQTWDEDQPQTAAAHLSITLDRQGKGYAAFNVFYPEAPDSAPDWNGITQSLNTLIPGCTFQTESEEYSEEEFESDRSFLSSCQFQPSPTTIRPNPWRFDQTIRLTPLLQQLPTVNLQQLELHLSVPNIGTVQTQPNLATLKIPALPFDSITSVKLYRQTFSAQQSISPITISFGYRPVDVIGRSLTIPLFILAPVLLVLFFRHRALRIQVDDPTPIWFGYLQFLNLLTLSVWVAWFGTYIMTGTSDMLSFVLGESAGLIKDILFFAPPAIAITLVFALSHPVFVKLGGSEWTRTDLIKQSFWDQLNAILPIMLLVTGGKTALSGNIPMGVVWIGASQLSRLILAPIMLRAKGLTTQAIMSGDLRDRIFALAQLADVKLQQVYVIPSGKGKMANAFAVKGGSVWLTDYLLNHMSRQEVDAVMAHELAHFQFGHHRTRAWVLILPAVAIPLILNISLAWIPGMNWVSVPIGIIASLLIYMHYSRKHEHEADVQAGVLTQDPAAMITALVKLARLSFIPLQWGRSHELLSTHPSMNRRIEAIAKRHHISDEDVEQLIKSMDDPVERYILPEAIAQDKLVFSTTFKQKRLLRMGWIAILIPTAAACLICKIALQLPAYAGVIYVTGILLTAALLLAIANYNPWISSSGLKPLLDQKLKRQGIETNGIMVGLAPDSELRSYESFLIWDFGYLNLESDRTTEHRLTYIGEQTQFALHPHQITAHQLKSKSPSWWIMPQLYFSWQDGDRTGTFYVMPYANTCRQQKQVIHTLNQQVQAWLQQSPTQPPPSDLNPLSAPESITVSSQAIAFQTATNNLILTLKLTLPMTLAVSLALGLPFGLQAGSALSALFIVILAQVFLTLPLWRYATQGHKDALG
jgi:Zn-dependent protease with chaperone function